MSIITLLTDFGTQDYFVGAMKGVILSINPNANIIDITHENPPQDVQSAAFNLLCCYENFPAGTIHVAVVDPGVGSDRRPLLIECAQQMFVGPDNGLFSWICDKEEQWRATQLTNEEFFRRPVSSTFHGRDIFAPIAAALSKGAEVNQLGKAIENIARLDSLDANQLSEGMIEGRIIHIDRFGNCITNLRSEIVPNSTLIIGGFEITSFRRFFAQAGPADDELFCLTGSAGFLEIAARNTSAAAIIGAQRGQEVKLLTRASSE